MSTIKTKLGILSEQKKWVQIFAEHDPVAITKDELLNQKYSVDILITDRTSTNTKDVTRFLNLKKNINFKKLIYLTEKNQDESLQYLSQFRADFFLEAEDVTSEFLYQQWQNLTQQEQDETYLSLSTELNQQYEILKSELEAKLFEKSKNLIESRKQIFEINNRFEVLRKTLYLTTEVKNLGEAESAFNDLLVGFNLITWLKIIHQSQIQHLEDDLKAQFESTYYISKITINNQDYGICFFKGDRRSFRKTDLNYFDKLAEALQINLNRYNNLLSLQQNERLFDLAFHSSPHPIIVIDQDYNTFQANLAAEKKADVNNENLKCYELLFGRNKPCTGCKLGSKFEIQHDVKTYAVQSNRFGNTMDSEKNYWVHFYEDISEQKALEGKFQQTARLSELGLISSSIAHELNNPLGGIISYLQIMKMELPSQHPFLKDIEVLNDAAQRMKKHIEDLLFFSRKEDAVKLESVDLNELFQKNLDLLQLQLKKEHLIISYQMPATSHIHQVSVIHLRNIIHLVFQFLLHKLKLKKQSKANFNGLVEVKISQDQINSYLIFSSNLGPHDFKYNSNDLSLITLEKSILDQGFQLVISEPQPLWLQLLIKLPH